MQVLYEEDGELKVGTVLAQAPASFQVETLHGRRAKVKAAHVLMSFERPGGAELLAAARAFAESLDVDFLWQCCGEREFGFEQLAREYVGRDPAPAESAGVLMKLHGAPMYFYRRARGRFQAAPADTLKRALAAIERKRLEQERIEAWAERLARFECPAEILALRDELLYAPQRAKPEARALEQACARTSLSPARLLERCGALPGSHEYHLNRFLYEFFPDGTGFPAHEPPAAPADLPLAAVEAFSLDDADTSEIDDAFSVERQGDGELRVGIHIAAPGLGFAPGSPLDAIARARLSTAYLPGRKYTMLPEDVIRRFSLDAGSVRPVVSLYLVLAPGDLAVRARHSRLERVRIAANLRHAEYEPLNAHLEAGTRAGLAREDELALLWRLAGALEAARGKPATTAGMVDYVFRVAPDGRVAIEPRRRGAPLDKLVAELMIAVNSAWGELLAERDVAAIYRVQTLGKVRMSVHPEAHDTLGVGCYAWMSSPLRRYVDLLNQWQLVATLAGRRAPFARSAETLLGAMRAFEAAATRYEEHQRAMEDYWCLRWLEQERVGAIDAVVLRDNVVRLDGLPLTTRVASLPELAPGSRVRLEVRAIDLIERSVACVWRATLATAQ